LQTTRVRNSDPFVANGQRSGRKLDEELCVRVNEVTILFDESEFRQHSFDLPARNRSFFDKVQVPRDVLAL